MMEFEDKLFSNDSDDEPFTILVADDEREPDQDNTSGIGFIVASIALTLLLCFCCKNRRSRPQPATAEELEEQEKQDKLEDPDYRQYLINRALIVRQVTGVDSEQGRLTLGEVQEEVDLSTTSSPLPPTDDAAAFSASHLLSLEDDDTIDYDDPSVACCSVCLEPYRVGSIVAWRRETHLDKNNNNENECVHVFHRDCIVPWLENPSHDDCPACRTVLLKPSWDEEENDSDDPEDDATTPNHVIIESQDGSNPRALQLARGLASRVRRAASSSRRRIWTGRRRGHDEQEQPPETDQQQQQQDASNSVTHHSLTSDMVFEIVHGLVSRAHRASCKLIGQDVGPPPGLPRTEEDKAEEEGASSSNEEQQDDEEMRNNKKIKDEEMGKNKSSDRNASHMSLRRKVMPLQEGQKEQGGQLPQQQTGAAPEVSPVPRMPRRRSNSFGTWWTRSQHHDDDDHDAAADDGDNASSSPKRSQSLSALMLQQSLRRVFSAGSALPQQQLQQPEPPSPPLAVWPTAASASTRVSGNGDDGEDDEEKGVNYEKDGLLLPRDDSVWERRRCYSNALVASNVKEWTSTSGSSCSGSEDGRYTYDDDARGMLLSSDDSVLWEKLRYNDNEVVKNNDKEGQVLEDGSQ